MKVELIFQSNYNGWTIDDPSCTIDENVLDATSEMFPDWSHPECDEDGECYDLSQSIIDKAKAHTLEALKQYGVTEVEYSEDSFST